MIDISVIIATRNEREYLEETLKRLSFSIREAQKSNVNVELIVVDSSDDDTSNIARGFTEKVYSFPLKGVSRARNYGAKMSHGRILTFMDADTLVQKNTLIEIFKAFHNGSIAAIAYVLPKNYNDLSFSEKLFYVLDRMFIKACGIIRPLLHFYNRGDIVAIRKDFFNIINGFNEKLNMMEITVLLNKLLRLGKIKVLRNPVYESSRRLKQWGFLKSHKIWLKNYLTFYLFKRLDANYEVVR
ncbi:hypothetical protein DRO59_04160 [Candidatus Bathyarchaeota archaeon]|nr:MAG: hypothetical protein DRO59_04160 [Candidatus Bathyarchaeota archaeon]